jgi:hypothetical protein
VGGGCRVHFYRAGESDRGARVILCFLSHQICMIYSARFSGLAQVAEPRVVTGQVRHLPVTGYCLLMGHGWFVPFWENPSLVTRKVLDCLLWTHDKLQGGAPVKDCSAASSGQLQLLVCVCCSFCN